MKPIRFIAAAACGAVIVAGCGSATPHASAPAVPGASPQALLSSARTSFTNAQKALCGTRTTGGCASTRNGLTSLTAAIQDLYPPTPPAPPSNDPSGEPMPTTAPAGYKQVLADDFNSPTDKCWGAYSANPIPSSPTGAWTPSDVSYSNGEAVLSSSYDTALGRWASGGMSSSACLQQAYGIYEVRFRMDPANGVKYAILMWPAHEAWPQGGEIDWGEDGGGNRSATTLTSIYAGAGGAEAKLPQQHITGDFSKWQTLELKWAPGQETEYLNGTQVAQITSPNVPSDPMVMDIQTETNTNCSLSWYSCIDSTTPASVKMDVDWVVAYAPDAVTRR